MTAEAAFVVPWVIFIIVWLIYLAYFEYDRCLVFQDDYLLATLSATRIKSVDEKQSWLDGHIGSIHGSKYMGTHSVETIGEVTKSKIIVSSTLNVSHPLNYHAGMIPKSNWNISDRVEADNFSYTERIRLFRSVGRVLGGG